MGHLQCLKSCGHSRPALRATPPPRWGRKKTRASPVSFLALFLSHPCFFPPLLLGEVAEGPEGGRVPCDRPHGADCCPRIQMLKSGSGSGSFMPMSEAVYLPRREDRLRRERGLACGFLSLRRGESFKPFAQRPFVGSLFGMRICNSLRLPLTEGGQSIFGRLDGGGSGNS